MKAGTYVNNLNGDMAYKSFKPNSLPILSPLEYDDDILNLLIKDNGELAKLEASINLIPNIDLFVSSYVRKEALISSQIEGTQCTLDDIFDPNVDVAKNLDVKDVVNYVNACNYGIERLNTLPLCNRFLKELHSVLMQGVRGEDKNPGEFRKSQNWIGPSGCSLKEARYIPPNVEDMNMLMNNLEEFMNNTEYDPLIQIALIHYQFETIHPFLDGNGRVGRLLITLFLIERNLLSKPILYISYFLKKNQFEYYDRISSVRDTGNYNQWIKFFLEAVYKASEDSFNTISLLQNLHNKNLSIIPSSNRTKDNLKALFEYIEVHPIINIKETAKDLNLSFNTVDSNIKKLVKLGILKETSNTQRKKIYSYEEYLNILRKDTE